MSQAKEAQIKLYKTREDKELDKVIALENKVKEMVANLRYVNSLKHEVDTLKPQLETQKTQFLNEIDRLSRKYYYADHMNAILGVYTDLDEVTNLQCDYMETWEKCERLEKELLKSRKLSKSFEALQIHAINLELDLQQCEDYQEYGLAIPDNPPTKKSRGKGSKGRKVVDDSQETVDVSKESEPEPAKKKTSAKRRVKKKVTLSADDNVISDDHDAALELAKSISQTEAEEAEAARKVHATHARIVTESVSESAKKKSGASSLTPAEQDAANIMQALKGSKKTSRRLPGTGESKDKTTGTDKGTDSNDDDSDDVTNDDDDDSDADGDNEASHSKKTGSDEDENPNLIQNEDEGEEYEEELKDIKHKEEGKGDAKMTDTGRDDGTQQTTYEQVKDDEHVILTTVHDTQKTEVLVQSSSISSDFANQLLNLDNVPPTNSEVISMMNVKVCHEEPSTHTPSLLNIPITSTPTPTPASTTKQTTTLIPTLPDFSSLFGFDQRVSVLEKKYAQLSTRLKDSIQNAFQSYIAEFKKKAKDERKRYIDLVEKSVKDIIKDEVKNQLPWILPKEVSEFATPMIQSTITESLDNVVLAKSSSQPKSTYEAETSLIECELKKILLDKMQKNREDKDKDEDLPAGSDQGLKKWKMSKDTEPSTCSKSKESKLSSSKGTKSKPKSFGKSAQVEESMFETTDTKMPKNQESDLGNTEDQPNVEATSKSNWFKKPERPPTSDPD
ncbi:hypothetical protein Tco_0261180 [Tanacetum coccineum]